MTFNRAFISYGRADSKAFATKLYDRLNEKGYEVWFDQNDIPLAVDFQEQINDGIAKADNFIFIIAPHSVNSAYCLKEIELALKFHKRIIPLLHVEQISQSTWRQRNPGKSEKDWRAYQQKGLHSSFPNMHPEIGKINWVYFREDADNFETALGGLIETFHKHEDYVSQHTEILNKALEWKSQQKQTRYLLTGEERQEAENWLKFRFKNEQPPCTPSDLHCEFITESIKNANNLMVNVFLAHAEADVQAMKQVRNLLRREGFTVWTSQTDVQTGEAFGDAINRGIEQADNLVYLLSPESQKSDYCRYEFEYALSLHKRVVPILLCPTEADSICSELRKLQYIDMAGNFASKLVKILRQDAAYYEEHKILLAKAIKWERQHQNPSILLRGYNLRSAEAWWKVAKQREKHLPTPLQEQFLTASLQQPPVSSLDVFISYSRADSDFARKLNDALQLQGKTTWFDQESIATGADFQQEIYRGIQSCDNFLFILSPRAVCSPYCADEVEYAAKLNKRFVTVLSQPVDSAKIHPDLAKVQWIDFNRQSADFNANFNQLVRTLDTDREYVRSHTKWSQRALEWDAKEKNDDLLLRGSELAIASHWWKRSKEEKKQPLVTGLQEEFITKSQEAKEAGEKEEKRRGVVLRSLLAGVSVALVASVGLGVMALRQTKKAQEQAKIAMIRADAYQLDRIMAIKPVESLVRAINSFGKSKDEPALEDELHLLKSNLHRAVGLARERILFQGHTEGVRSVAISPDGQTIVSGNFDNTVRLWDRSGNPVGEPFIGHRSPVNSVAISPDGQTIVSGSVDNTVRLWDLSGNPLGNPFIGHRSPVNSVAFSPDGQTIVSGSWDKTVRLWDLSGNPVGKLFIGHRSAVMSVAFSPDGQTIVSGSSDGTVRLWDLSGNPVGQPFIGHKNSVMSVAFSPDGQRIVSGSADNTVRLWDLSGNPVGEPLTGHTNFVISVAFSPDGQRIVSGSFDNTVRLWDLSGNPVGQPFIGHTEGVRSVAISPDGQRIVSGSYDSTIQLWERSGKPVGEPLTGHRNFVMSVAFSPDGQRIVSGSFDKTVRLWERSGNPVGEPLRGHTEGVRSVAFSPDGQTIVSGSYDNTVRLWDLSGNPLGEPFIGHTDALSSVAFSPDGQTIVSGSYDKTVRLWDLSGNRLGEPFIGHTDIVMSVAISSDGQTIVSGSVDKTVRLWDLSGNPVGEPLRGHTDAVSSVALSPDGQTIVSGSADKTVRLWREVTGQAWLGRGCDRLQLHPVFVHPEPELAELSQQAVDICMKEGGWSDRSIAQFRVQQGRALARFDGDVPGALAKFQEAKKLDESWDLEALALEAKRFAASVKITQRK